MGACTNVALYWHTLRHLRPVQLYGRAYFKLAKPRPDLSPAPPRRKLSGPWQDLAPRCPSLTGPQEFWLLNEAGSLSEDGWGNPRRPKLWRYNQHYFDDLNTTDARERNAWHVALISDWIASNPAGRGPGWESYPTSLRIVNWVKWPIAGHEMPAHALDRLAVQTRWLARRVEWHLLGNHLFANAKALMFAGVSFDGKEADGWRQQTRRILMRELPEQILSDGGQFELSPMYHALALEDVLDLVNLLGSSARKDDELLASLRSRVSAMQRWLHAMCHPDGRIAFFNDGAFGVAPETKELDRYAAELGLPPDSEASALTLLERSGYVRTQRGPAVMIADLAEVGPDYLPGHVHADTLSFEFSLGTQRVAGNSGTSVCEPGEERLRQRGTAARSTLCLDDCDSSEVWGAFRVSRRARPLQVRTEADWDTCIARAAHDGYRRLRGARLHYRKWLLSQENLRVTDRVTGGGEHRAEARFHLAPGLQPTLQNDGTVALRDSSEAAVASVSVPTPQTIETRPSTWHPEFGRSEPSHCLAVAHEGALPLHIETVFRWAGS